MRRSLVLVACGLLTVAGLTAVAPPAVASTPGAAGAFVSTTPTRLLDTRHALGATTPGPGTAIHLQVAGQGPVPYTGVQAVVLNVTVNAPTANGYLTAYPTGTPRPGVSNLNYLKGQTVPNLVVVPLGTTGQLDLYNGSTGTTQILADVAGYYLDGEPTAPGAFVSTTPTRLLDTRHATGGTTPGPNGTVHLQVTGTTVPTGASAVVLNVTANAPTANGYLTAYPTGTPRPGVSNLNYLKGQTVPNLVVVPLGTTGQLDLYNGSTGTTQILADVAGYYLAPAPSDTAPDRPTRFETSPAARNGSPAGCSRAPYAALGSLGGGTFTLGASVASGNPGVQTVHARFRLRDLGGSGTGPAVDVLDDTTGRSSDVPAQGRYVLVRIPGDTLVDGHLYNTDVVADDGTRESVPTETCWFWADARAPADLAVTSRQSSFRVGTAATFDVSAADVVPDGGRPSGIDHFAYAIDSPSGLAGDGGMHVPATGTGTTRTASFSYTPTSFGSHTVYVAAIDRAGNQSNSAAFPLYAAG